MELFKAQGGELLHICYQIPDLVTIGNNDVSATICAEDMTLLANSAISQQAMIYLTSYVTVVGSVTPLK
jgi:hypothetical protein